MLSLFHKKRAETRERQLADKCLEHLLDNQLPPSLHGNLSVVFVFRFTPIDKQIFITQGGIRMGEFVYKPKYAVIVMCKDEVEQKSIFEKLQQMGLAIKVVSV